MDDAARATRLERLAELRAEVRALESELGLESPAPMPPPGSDLDVAAYGLVAQYASDFFSIHAADGRYLFASPGVESLVGWRPDQLVGTDAYRYFHPDDLAAIAESHAAQGSGGPIRIEYRLRRADGGWRWVETVSRSHVAEDGVQQIVCITRDVEDRHAAQERQVELLRRLEDFVSVAAHDLKSPLQAIIGHVDQVLATAGQRLTAGEAGALERAVVGAERMAELVDNLLLWSRMETEAPQLERTDLGAVVRGVLEDFAAELEGADVRVELGLLPEVPADPALMALLVRNLVSNALKYRRPAATLELSIGATRTNGSWRLVVQDNGVGIPQDAQARIFEMFTRLPDTASAPGHGIGLALCQRIAQHHEGTMTVESEPGQGTTMVVTLPAA